MPGANVSSEVKWIWREARKYRIAYGASIIAILFGGGLTLLDPLIVRWMVDTILPQRNLSLLFWAILTLFLSYSGRFALLGLSGILNRRATEHLVYNIRLQLVTHLSTLSNDYYDKTPPGDLIFRLEQDVDYLNQFCSEMLSGFLSTIVTICGAVVLLFALNPRLTVLVLPVVSLFIFARRAYRSQLKLSAEAVLSSTAARVAFLENYITSVTQFQLLQRETYAIGRYKDYAASARRSQILRKIVEFKAGFIPLLGFVTGVMATVYYGAYLIVGGAFSIGGLVAFYSYLVKLFDPLAVAVDIDTRILWVKASITRIKSVLDTKPTIQTPSDPVALKTDGPHSINIKNVSFAYGSSRLALTGVSLDCRSGEKIALIGKTGSGKSTLAKLLCRLYDPSEGVILLDQQELAKVALSELRSIVVCVPQDAVVFEGTILENLLHGNPQASIADCLEVIKAAQLETAIKRLPQRLNHSLGVRGAGLSGGEKQRLAIARVLLRRPRVLILDEATSALDRETERRLLDALEPWLLNTTTIMISHRPAILKWADRVIVLERGRVVRQRWASERLSLGVGQSA